eukprot:TRINITY_DN7940_c0_g1_i1.p1 TRINITY_DN7940_c0_g1~~TRINITY_DN7940_c0_g1_i1.p1  ORF type:complete len:319 (-),score=57.47 TRINITY_DN7940_c0_g1_i1:101-1021(-)
MATAPKFLVHPKLGEFSEEVIPLEEGFSFLSLDKIEVPADRPYTWTNTVSSLDNVISFKEIGKEESNEIALSHIKGSGSVSDWRLLNMGWAQADAVLASIKDRSFSFSIKRHYPELLEYREKEFKKVKQPLLVYLTRNGVQFDFDEKIFSDTSIDRLILTIRRGYQTTIATARNYFKISSEASDEEVVNIIKEKKNIRVKILHETGFTVKDAATYLYKEEGIRLMEVTAGCNIMTQFLQQKSIDECRYTRSGLVCGHINSKGEQRPLHFSRDTTFLPDNAPLLHIIGLRMYGFHHIFVRGLWQYRH